MSIQKIGVVGAGQMGNGIAHVAATCGLDVIMHDIQQEFVDRGLATIDKNLQRGVDKGRMTGDEKGAVLSRVSGTTNCRSCRMPNGPGLYGTTASGQATLKN